MRTHDYEIDVPFVLGKARPRVTMHGTYTPAKTKSAEKQISKVWRKVAGEQMAPAHIPVMITIKTERPIPISRPKHVTAERDTFKPDADNIAKLVMDALNGVAWVDDAQVTQIDVTKGDRTRLCEHAKTTIRVIWREQ